MKLDALELNQSKLTAGRPPIAVACRGQAR